MASQLLVWKMLHVMIGVTVKEILSTQLYRTRWLHAIILSVIIEFSRCIGTYSSAKFELLRKNSYTKKENG